MDLQTVPDLEPYTKRQTLNHFTSLFKKQKYKNHSFESYQKLKTKAQKSVNIEIKN